MMDTAMMNTICVHIPPAAIYESGALNVPQIETG